MTVLTDEERAKLVALAREIAVDDLIAMTVSWTETQKVARALLAADAAVRGMREALINEIERDIAHCSTVPHVFKVLQDKCAAIEKATKP